MLVIKRRMSTIKQPGKEDNVYQRPLGSHNFLKIITRETLLKVFLTSTCMMTQSRCKLKRVRMPKGMALEPSRVETPN
jgi:hypothetical protein